MILVALAMPDRVSGLVGLACAPDFTKAYLTRRLSPAQRETIERDGVVYLPSQYSDDPSPITMRLIEDGNRRLVLEAPIPLTCPIRLLHGMDDPDVRWQRSVLLAERLESSDVQITLLKGAGHWLSEPPELDLLGETLAKILEDHLI